MCDLMMMVIQNYYFYYFYFNNTTHTYAFLTDKRKISRGSRSHAHPPFHRRCGPLDWNEDYSVRTGLKFQTPTTGTTGATVCPRSIIITPTGRICLSLNYCPWLTVCVFDTTKYLNLFSLLSFLLRFTTFTKCLRVALKHAR